jgi:ankyrin repeat protein
MKGEVVQVARVPSEPISPSHVDEGKKAEMSVMMLLSAHFSSDAVIFPQDILARAVACPVECLEIVPTGNVNVLHRALGRLDPSPKKNACLPVETIMGIGRILRQQLSRNYFASQDDAGNLPLHVAVIHNQPVCIIEWLVDSHPDPGPEDPDNTNAILGKEAEAISRFNDRGLKVSNCVGWTALHMACNFCDNSSACPAEHVRAADVAKALFEMCPSAALLVDIRGETALHRAVKNHNRAMVSIMVSQSPELAQCADAGGYWPIHHAFDFERHFLEPLCEEARESVYSVVLDICTVLLKARPDSRSKTTLDGQTPHELALSNGASQDLLDLLFDPLEELETAQKTPAAREEKPGEEANQPYEGEEGADWQLEEHDGDWVSCPPHESCRVEEAFNRGHGEVHDVSICASAENPAGRLYDIIFAHATGEHRATKRSHAHTLPRPVRRCKVVLLSFLHAQM